MGKPSKFWIKLYHEILYDVKVGRMPDRLWRRMVELFLLAGEVDRAGELPKLPDMAWTLRTTPEQLEIELNDLVDRGIAHFDDDRGRWVVTNFAERQAASTAADRMRRYRKRKKQKTKKQSTDDRLQRSYSDVTTVTADVTNRNEYDADNETDRAIQMVLDLQDRWLTMTGAALPSDREPRVNDYFVPLNNLLLRVDWDVDTAETLLAQKRAEMLRDGKTPYRAAAVVPRILAELDLGQMTDATRRSSAENRLERIAGLINGEKYDHG